MRRTLNGSVDSLYLPSYELISWDCCKQMAALKQSSAPDASASTSTTASFQALGGNANSIRDLASKIREDPLLAIKKQEQKAYEELMKNPKRLKELRDAREAANGGKKDKKEKKHKHEDPEREERKRRTKEAKRGMADDRDRSRSPRDDRDRYRDDQQSSSRYPADRRARSPSPRRDSPPPPRRDREREYRRDDRPSNGYSRPAYNDRPRDRQPYPPPQSAEDRERARAIAEEKLAAMSASAQSIAKDRAERLDKINAQDRIEAEREARERDARRVKGGANLDPTFLKEQQKASWALKVEGRG